MTAPNIIAREFTVIEGLQAAIGFFRAHWGMLLFLSLAALIVKSIPNLLLPLSGPVSRAYDLPAMVNVIIYLVAYITLTLALVAIIEKSQPFACA